MGNSERSKQKFSFYRFFSPLLLAATCVALLVLLLPATAYAACANPSFGQCVRDEFSILPVSYANNDGSQNWDGNWTETGDDGGPSGGAIQIVDETLRLQGVSGSTDETGRFIQRAKTIPASYISAIVTFDLEVGSQIKKSDQITVGISTNGGSTFTTVVTYDKDTLSGSKTFDLGNVAGQTVVVRFGIASNLNSANKEYFSFDNVEIRYALPQAVALNEPFTAAPILEGPGVRLTWETVNERENLGFYLDQATSAHGPWTRLNLDLLPSVSPGSPQGYAYAYVDRTAVWGHTYLYRLSSVDLAGVVEVVETTQIDHAAPFQLWLPRLLR